MAQRRAATDKAKATRARSWQKNQSAKSERVAEQEKRHAHNVKVGSTGKQRANQKVKDAKRRKEVVTNIAAGYAEALAAEMEEAE